MWLFHSWYLRNLQKPFSTHQSSEFPRFLIKSLYDIRNFHASSYRQKPRSCSLSFHIFLFDSLPWNKYWQSSWFVYCTAKIFSLVLKLEVRRFQDVWFYHISKIARGLQINCVPLVKYLGNILRRLCVVFPYIRFVSSKATSKLTLIRVYLYWKQAC